MTRRSIPLWRKVTDNTLLTGIVVLVVVGAAVFISYRAQNGLPLESRYRVEARVLDAQKLNKNADVRIGGTRIGQILAIEARPGGPGHPPYSALDLSLNKNVGPLPADTTVEVRLASVLGGKYLDLVPGKRGPHTRTIPNDGVIPLANAKSSVDIDEALQIFDPPGRAATQDLIQGLGDGVAGRGTAINETIGTFERTLPGAVRVLQVLSAPSTDLRGFIRGLAAATAALAPVAPTLGALLDHAAETTAAIDAAGDSLGDALAAAPGAEDETTRALVELRPTLSDAAAVARALQPAGRMLPATLSDVDRTIRIATPVDPKVGALARPLDSALSAVGGFTADPHALSAVQALKGQDLATFGGSAFVGLGAILSTTSKAQLNCNSAALWMRNLASTASEGDSGGNWLRMIPIFQSQQTTHAAVPDADLHQNFYPHENESECEAGNEPFAPGQALGNPPGNQPKNSEITRPGG